MGNCKCCETQTSFKPPHNFFLSSSFLSFSLETNELVIEESPKIIVNSPKYRDTVQLLNPQIRKESQKYQNS